MVRYLLFFTISYQLPKKIMYFSVYKTAEILFYGFYLEVALCY